MKTKKILKRIALTAVVTVLMITASMIPINKASVMAKAESSHPYPSLLDYTELEKSFNSLAYSQILPQYRDYVLEALKYHIESNAGDYRVAKNLMRAYNEDEDGNVIFFFDGCSQNLGSSAPCFSGYIKSGNRYNMSAVCIVLQADENGKAKVVFATKNCSTMPDNVRNASLNGDVPPGSLRDGTYNFITTIHYTYAGFNIVTTPNSHVRACTYRSSYISQGSGINIHRRGYSYSYITDYTCNSTGCFNIGGANTNQTEYNNFVRQITGYNNAGSGYYGYDSGQMMGIVIVDRSNYKTQLQTIYGDDTDFGISSGWTKKQISDAITAGSDTWNKEINDRLNAPKYLKGDADGSGKIDSTDYIIVKRHILNISKLTGAYFTAADMDGNGKIDSTDYIAIKRIILGLA
ncbi:MAG: dockerin type I repeat-containing protein [Clostridia bacterium]|nr:dockerin type I repeat-containing protein [Clostridia bacterium]